MNLRASNHCSQSYFYRVHPNFCHALTNFNLTRTRTRTCTRTRACTRTRTRHAHATHTHNLSLSLSHTLYIYLGFIHSTELLNHSSHTNQTRTWHLERAGCSHSIHCFRQTLTTASTGFGTTAGGTFGVCATESRLMEKHGRGERVDSSHGSHCPRRYYLISTRDTLHPFLPF